MKTVAFCSAVSDTTYSVSIVDGWRTENSDRRNEWVVHHGSGNRRRSGGKQALAPELRSGIRIQCIHRIVVGAHVEDVMDSAIYREGVYIERLSPYSPVHSSGPDLAEAGRVHVGGSQLQFVGLQPRSIRPFLQRTWLTTSIVAEAVAVEAGPLDAVAVMVHVPAVAGAVNTPALLIDPHVVDQVTSWLAE